MHTNVDVVIIGAGLAGTYVALNLPSHMKVLIISSNKNNSSLAQGGIASCINEEDECTAHIKDTLTAGHYTNDAEAVIQLIQNGPKEIQILQNLGVEFDTNSDGNINLTLEGGHSKKRVLHINGDQTGKLLMNQLEQSLIKQKNVQHIHKASLIKINYSNEGTEGILYEINNKVHIVHSQFVVIATGGIGDIYRFTTNQKGAIGAGIAIANSANIEIENMRYVQFHPTAYWHPTTNKYFLITEALRGEGAYLVDESNKRFMLDIHKDGELAPRDIVSKAIFEIITGTNPSNVYLDTSHMETDFLKKRFPNIYKNLMMNNIQLGRDLIPIAPVAHYTIGGITVDLDGKTSMKRLYACGEVTSSGVHGANRLASNSLLECLVYGRHVANSIAENYKSAYTLSETNVQPDLFENVIISDVPDYKTLIQRLMTKYAGIVRTDEGLFIATKQLTKYLNDLSTIKYKHIEYFHLYNMAMVALMVINDAVTHDSLGCHQKDI